ncbi:MAG: hypothetical protein DKT66_14125 [Candidatus Melainabacteria bacterium]|nr:MAG: hypothetical protein DKT66_14125 [Candidatus Melainabacteria bacterium]
MPSTATREILQSFRRVALENANEASTRLKVIDRILREVLDWSDEDISPEEHVTEDGKTTFADYVLRTANTALIIEAKKVGVAFASQRGQLGRRVKLTKAFLESDMGEAVIQARDYARKMGIDFAVATNGSTWIVFPAQRHDQVRFHDSTALVFWSLEEILSEDYQEFSDLLSRSAVISGSLETALIGRAENQSENRKLGSFYATSQRVSNPLFPVIEGEVLAAFSDSIVDLDEESFKRCYVATPESIKFDRKIRMHISRRELIANEVIQPMKKWEAHRLYEKVKASAAENRKSLAMLLLGTVGVGKTTFLHYMRKVVLKELFAPEAENATAHWLHLDFLNCGTQSATDFIYRSLRDYISQDPVLQQFDLCTKLAYADEINALRSGPLSLIANSEEKINERISDLILKEYQDVSPYVTRILKHVTKKSTFFLVVDNIDQIEDEDIQSKLFAESFSIARALSLNLVLALRQSTYSKHRNSPTIDAFDFEVVQIDAPMIASVLSKRFALVELLASGKKTEFIAENGAKVRVEDAAQIVELVKGSVLGTEIGTRIEVLATEDIRLALRMTREFLERGYTNPGRAIEYHRQTGQYMLPRHEAFRAIILGTRKVYSEDFSPIGNPLDSRLAVNQAQLLRLFTLSAIVSYASEGGFRSVDGATISDNLRKIGFGDVFTARILSDLCKHRFLFTANHGEPTITSSFLPSRLGGYIVRELLSNFTFLENMMFDTYIADTAVWQKLRQLSSKIENQRKSHLKMKLRVNRVKLFFDHMKDCYQPLVEESQKRVLPAQWCHDVFAERQLDLRNELAKVLRSSRRTYRQLKQGQTEVETDEDLSRV